MEHMEFNIDCVKELCEKYELNIFHKIALYCAMYGDEQQSNFIMRELQKLGVDDLAISGFIKLMEVKEIECNLEY